VGLAAVSGARRAAGRAESCGACGAAGRTAGVNSVLKFALILAGGALGSLLRYLLQGLGQELAHGTFPLGTLIVNVVGCFAIGFLNALFTGPVPIRAEYRIGLVVGVLGGFTTFSAFGWETFSLANEGQLLRATANVLLSVCLGVSAVFVGCRLAERWFGVT
jgi:CrcB protein